MSEAKNGDLIPSPAAGAIAPAPVNPLANTFVADVDRRVMSFDPKTVEGRQLLQKCEEEPDKSVREMVNMKIRLKHVYAKPVDLVSKETGEVFVGLRVCLVTTDGQVHACVSEGVRQAIGRLITGHGVPPWKDGVPVVVSLKATKSGHNWLTLLEDFTAAPAGKGGRS